MTKPIVDENTDISNIDFRKHSFYQLNVLTEDFIEKHKYRVNWDLVCSYQELSESFIEKYIDRVYWPFLLKYKLSNKFITKYIDKSDLSLLKLNKNIDQNFIEKLELLR